MTTPSTQFQGPPLSAFVVPKIPVLRPYQGELKAKVREKWMQGARNVLMRLDTGGGKTVILADLVREHNGASCVIAHRHVLVGQLSCELAKYGVFHNIIADAKTCRAIAAQHIAKFGRSFYQPGARCAVASVDTLVGAEGLDAWAAQVTLWIVDEGHHLVLDNKWHKAIMKFSHPACLGLLPTATPGRADGKGLGRHADGVADVMVEGPPMRWLILQGYLCDYRIIVPPSDLEQFLGSVGASGDFSPAQLKAASKGSHIVGDVVAHYLTHARGKLGITFTTDIDTAAEMAASFRAAGVRGDPLTGKTDQGLRRQMMAQFEARKLDQLVAVDIISEGYDLPAVEVASFGRPTESLGLYMQQFGRALRPIYAPGFDLETQEGRLAAIANSTKPRALIIDHAGNTIRHHGPPDMPRVWSLDRRDRKSSKSDAIPLRPCLSCLQPFERYRVKCKWCGVPVPPPSARNAPKMVEGDLVELDAETLARMRGDQAVVDLDPREYQEYLVARRAPPESIARHVRSHVERHTAQLALREAMGWWCAYRHAEGLTDREIQKLFYLRFGIDVLTAQALGAADADTLRARLTTPSTAAIQTA